MEKELRLARQYHKLVDQVALVVPKNVWLITMNGKRPQTNDMLTRYC